MTNKSRDNVRRELEVIRKLMDVDNLSDREIINQLQVTERTFYRYKKKIMKQEVKKWEQEDIDARRYREAKFLTTLEYCYRETKKIIDNPHSKPMERIEAIKTLDVLSSQIARLSKEGPIFTPTLPMPNKMIPIASQEVTV